MTAKSVSLKGRGTDSSTIACNCTYTACRIHSDLTSARDVPGRGYPWTAPETQRAANGSAGKSQRATGSGATPPATTGPAGFICWACPERIHLHLEV